MFILFAKQNTGCSLVRVVKCYGELVNQVLCKECEWKAALRSQALVDEACWLSNSLRDFADNLSKLRLCTSTRAVHGIRHSSSHVRHDLSHWFHGNMSRFAIDVEEMLIIRAIPHRLLPLIRTARRQQQIF